jgi:nucleotidyltransferase/DNA polymerase involved in DNA repair
LLEVPELLAPLDISDLHGFGWSTKQKAQEKLGTTNLGELAKKSKAILMDALGKGTGETLYKAVRGIDEKKLESDKPRKSVSCEINVSLLFQIPRSPSLDLSSTAYVSRTMRKLRLLSNKWRLKSRNDWMQLTWLGARSP